MIVYGVAANVSIAKLFIAGVMPGCCWRRCSWLHRRLGAVQQGQGARRPMPP
jgi:TRAP-type C4-dicarboxylate transport system permease large subunit